MYLFLYPPTPISVTIPPTAFTLDGIPTTVTEDTGTPANNTPLPSKLFIQKDGVTYPVNKDTGTPANTLAVPVEIVSASGTTINITAGDIDIHTTDLGVNFDAVRIGDGSGNYIGVNASSEAKTHDASLLAELMLKADLTETQPVSLASVPLPAGASTSAKQDLLLAELQLKADLTETQPVSIAGSVAVTGPLTDAQLRASAVPVSMATAPLPTGGATSAKQDTGNTSLASIDAKLTNPLPVSGTFFQPTQPVSAVSLPLPTGASTSAKQDLLLTELQLKADLTETQPVSLASVPLPTGASTLAEQQTQTTKLTSIDAKDFATQTTLVANGVLVGAVTETAPATDTASSGLNGRLQRIAQRITSLIALLPTSLGQKTMANSLTVTLASDQSTLNVIQQAMSATFQEILNLTNSVQTFTAPANSKWCKVMTDETNTANIRVKLGATATTTSGMQFQPGRSEDFMIAGNVSVICETSANNQKIMVQFGV